MKTALLALALGTLWVGAGCAHNPERAKVEAAEDAQKDKEKAAEETQKAKEKAADDTRKAKEKAADEAADRAKDNN